MENKDLPSVQRYSSTKLFLSSLLIFSLFHVKGQQAPYMRYLAHPWVDSVLASLSAEERIAQSIWINIRTGEDISQVVKTDRTIRKYGIGGLIFSPGNEAGQSALIHYYQSVSKVPLAIVMDGLRRPYPNPPALEAIVCDSLKYRMGKEIARQFRELGIQVLLTPWKDEYVAAGLTDSRILSAGTPPRGPGQMAPDSLFTAQHGFAGTISDNASDVKGLAWRFRAENNQVETAIGQVRSWLNTTGDTGTIDQRARMVLAFKYWSGLPPATAAHHADNKALIRDLYKHSLTVLNNVEHAVPIRDLGDRKMACISIHQASTTAFQHMVSQYTRTDHFCWDPATGSRDSLLGKLSSYDVVIAGVYGSKEGPYPTSGIPDETDSLLSSLSATTQLISVYFGDPADLEKSAGLQSSDGLVLAYQQNIYTEELAAQLIFGGIGGRGRLPVDIGHRYSAGEGIQTAGGIRLQYGFPENAGVSSRKLNQEIDSIAIGGLKAGAYPGCEVMIARKGIVIFHKTYGYHTYDERIAVEDQDLYDLASVTKVSGPLPGLMLLEGMGRFSHEGRLVDYCPCMKGSNKADLSLKDILAHQAGLYPYIKYWEHTVKKNGDYKRRFIRYNPSDKFPVQVADRIYLKNNYRKRIVKAIKKSPLGEKKYLYSGLSFMLFPIMIEKLSGERYEDFLAGKIYHPLGAWDLVFNPYRFYPRSRIVPTEIDTLFRKQLVQGYVHDEAAAMMGGFSGNAGLFSTANDLLKLFEMYRRMGSYGGEQLIAEDIMKIYTSYQFPENGNRRGLGFDKPSLGERDGTTHDYPCPGASPSSFGHSGFTGTFAWADPEYEISYVFLSNRVYPTRDNDLAARMDIRTSILQSVYDSMIK